MNDKTEVIHGHITSHILEEEGNFPNNPNLPVVVYKGALLLHPADEPEGILEIFEKNGWSNGWVSGIYDYHHYHSNVHEVLGVYCGVGDVQLGGPAGICVELNRGDVLIIPAGVAHRALKLSDDFLCAGAYPGGMDYDINYGREEEVEHSKANIQKVSMPQKDPLFGKGGPLMEQWEKK